MTGLYFCVGVQPLNCCLCLWYLILPFSSETAIAEIQHLTSVFLCKVFFLHKKVLSFFLYFLERVNNFPPLPAILRIKPCFYHNIEEEIPAIHQQLVRKVYILWMRKCSQISVF